MTDGTYYWRVRGLSAAKRPGPWSSPRKIVKAWTEAPQLQGPTEGAQITWPSTPLVLRWSEVPYAYEYIVKIATDEQMANVVLGTSATPTKTEGTVFAMPSTLQAGQTYYWQITPVDATGHRGTPSRVGKFSWAWPTTTSTEVVDLNPDPRVFEPEFKWAAVPGAARYEVEVSSASGFPAGSKWCCGETVLGTSFVPTLGARQQRILLARACDRRQRQRRRMERRSELRQGFRQHDADDRKPDDDGHEAAIRSGGRSDDERTDRDLVTGAGSSQLRSPGHAIHRRVRLQLDRRRIRCTKKKP